ncbi:MAG: hypothetical protein AAGA03_16535 [Planctomycetota bacterium]
MLNPPPRSPFAARHFVSALRFAVAGTLVATLAANSPSASRAAENVSKPSAANAATSSFAIESAVFHNQLGQPYRHSIVFYENKAYDLPADPLATRVAVDFANEQVIVIEPEQKTKSIVTFAELMETTMRTKAAVSQRKHAERFGLDAKVQRDDTTGRYRVELKNATYAATSLGGDHESRAKRYGAFADLAAQLNLIRGLGAPPFARMRLNQAMAGDGKLPGEVTRTTAIDQVRSTHQLRSGVLPSDLRQIEDFDNRMALYTPVPIKRK